MAGSLKTQPAGARLAARPPTPIHRPPRRRSGVARTMRDGQRTDEAELDAATAGAQSASSGSRVASSTSQWPLAAGLLERVLRLFLGRRPSERWRTTRQEWDAEQWRRRWRSTEARSTEARPTTKRGATKPGTGTTEPGAPEARATGRRRRAAEPGATEARSTRPSWPTGCPRRTLGRECARDAGTDRTRGEACGKQQDRGCPPWPLGNGHGHVSPLFAHGALAKSLNRDLIDLLCVG